MIGLHGGLIAANLLAWHGPSWPSRTIDNAFGRPGADPA
jgi:hypothetical protein